MGKQDALVSGSGAGAAAGSGTISNETGLPSDGLNAKQVRFLAALCSEPTVEAAAAKAGCAKSSAYRWLALPAFQAALRHVRRRAMGQASSQLAACSGEAVATLRRIAGDSTAPAPARVTAARALLDSALRAVEVDDLLDRVAQLERGQDERAGI